MRHDFIRRVPSTAGACRACGYLAQPTARVLPQKQGDRLGKLSVRYALHALGDEKKKRETDPERQAGYIFVGLASPTETI